MTVNGGRVVGTIPELPPLLNPAGHVPGTGPVGSISNAINTKGLTGVPATTSTTTPEVCTHSTAPASKTTVLPITPRSAVSDRSKAIFAGHPVVIGVGVGVEKPGKLYYAVPRDF